MILLNAFITEEDHKESVEETKCKDDTKVVGFVELLVPAKLAVFSKNLSAEDHNE